MRGLWFIVPAMLLATEGAASVKQDPPVVIDGDLTVNGNLLVAGVYGPDMVENGSFSVDMQGWTGAGWVQADGAAMHQAGTAEDLVQLATVAVPGRTYRVTYRVIAGTTGAVQAYIGGVWGGQKTASGVYTYYPTATSDDPLMFRPEDSDFDGGITDVVVEELSSDSKLTVEKPAEFRMALLVADRIDFPDGMPISIGYQAMPASTTGLYNQDSQNIAIGHQAGYSNTEGHVTAVGWRAGRSNTTGVLTAFGKNAGASNTDGHATFFGNYAGVQNTISASTCVGDEACGRNVNGEAVAVGYYAAHGNVDGYITAVGYQAGLLNTTGAATVVGYRALFSSTDASEVTVIGDSAAYFNTADSITAVGHRALYGATSDSIAGSTAVGAYAGYSNDSGRLTAVGYRAGTQNLSGNVTAVGWQAGTSNTSGHLTALGYQAGYKNLSSHSVVIGHNAGFHNATTNITAVGYRSGENVTSGRLTAVGYQSGLSTTSGHATLLGYGAGFSNTSGDIIAIGYQAGYGSSGANAAVTDTGGILIGNLASRGVPSATTLTNYVGIGDGVVVDSSNSVVLGNAATLKTVLNGNVGIGSASPTSKLHVVGSVRFEDLPGSVGAGSLCLTSTNEVVVNSGSDNCLASSRSAKRDIVALEEGSTSIVGALQPVSFKYDHDPVTVRYGFIAEEVAQVDPRLATRDASGTITGIDDRAMLAAVVTALQASEARLKEAEQRLDVLTAQVRALEAARGPNAVQMD